MIRLVLALVVCFAVDALDFRRALSASTVKVGPLGNSETVEFLVTLALPNRAQLDQFLADLYNPASKDYQQFVTPEEFRDRFAPSQEDVDKLTAYLESNSLYVIGVAPNNFYLTVQGAVKDVNNLFQVGLTSYKNQDGTYFRSTGQDETPQLPEGITGVIGLDNTTLMSRQLNTRMIPASSSINNVTDLDRYTIITANKLRKIYNLTTKLTGKGQTIALVEFDNYNPKDIVYWKQFWNTSTEVDNIYLSSSCRRCCTIRRPKGVKKCTGKFYACKCTKPAKPPGITEGGAFEATLDIEMLLSISPGLDRILVYIAPNTGKGFVEMIIRIATDNNASVISTSWGLPDIYVSQPTAELFSDITKQMTAQGQTMFAASGDKGAYDKKKTLTVDFPAALPLVTGVGGTHLVNLTSRGTFAYETSWNGEPKHYASGGGFTYLFSIPDYQNGSISRASLCSPIYRNVPDVSLVSSGEPGFAVYFRHQWYGGYGTSFAAPSWAALTGIINQYRASIGKGRLGSINPTLYQISHASYYNQVFRDIKDNSTNMYYPAVPGYDCSTGLGTFLGDNLILALGGCATGKKLTSSASGLACT